MLKFPYGQADLYRSRTEGCVCVDRTAHVRDLGDLSDVLKESGLEGVNALPGVAEALATARGPIGTLRRFGETLRLQPYP